MALKRAACELLSESLRFSYKEGNNDAAWQDRDINAMDQETKMKTCYNTIEIEYYVRSNLM